MKAYSDKQSRLGLAKASLLTSALFTVIVPEANADVSAPSAKSGDTDFFSSQFSFEAGPHGVRINGSPLAPGVIYAKGASVSEKVPWLGVATEPLEAALAAQLGLGESDGITVTTTVPDSPAAKAGIENFDILLEVDGVKLDSPQTLRELIRGKADGDVAKIVLLRKGERREIEATLVEKSRAVAEATDDAVEENAASPTPRRRGIDPFDDDFLKDQFFGGFGGFGKFGGLGNMKEIEEHMDRIRQEMESRFEDMRNTDPLGGGAPGAASDFMHMENSVMSFSDGDGLVTIKREDGKTHVEARDAENKIVFEGPADSEEERAKMPEDVRAKVEKFEKSGMNFGNFGLFKRSPRAVPEPLVNDKVRRKSEIEKEKERNAEEEGKGDGE